MTLHLVEQQHTHTDTDTTQHNSTEALSQISIVHQEKYFKKREIKEGIFIKAHQNELVNGNVGAHISDIWNQFLGEVKAQHVLNRE